MTLNLHNLITNDTNIIEIYLLSSLSQNKMDNSINIFINNAILNKSNKEI